MLQGTKVPLSIFRFSNIFGPYWVCEVAKGPKNGKYKVSTFSKTNYEKKKVLRSNNYIFKNHFLDQHFFLMILELKSVNSISSSFGKTLKRLVNYFSQMLAQMAPLRNSRFWGNKIGKLTFYGFRKQKYCCEKLPTYFSTIWPNKGEVLFGHW